MTKGADSAKPVIGSRLRPLTPLVEGASTPSVFLGRGCDGKLEYIRLEHNIDQFTDQVREEVRKTVDRYLDFLEKTVSSSPLGDAELGGKAKDCAEKNISISRDYLHNLSRQFPGGSANSNRIVAVQLGLFGEN